MCARASVWVQHACVYACVHVCVQHACVCACVTVCVCVYGERDGKF